MTCSMENTVSKLKASSQRPISRETRSQVRWVSSWAVMVPIMPIISPVSSQAEVVAEGGGVAGGEQVMTAQAAQGGAEAQRVALAGAPERREDDQAQQWQGQPELGGEDGRVLEAWGAGVVPANASPIR